MTPGARVAAAIDVLDDIQGGRPAEQALLHWSRASRFAGSKDREAVRDYVFDALRHWRSDAARGQGTTGRSRMIGRLHGAGVAPESLFTGEGYAPEPLTQGEHGVGRAVCDAEALDVPDWLWPDLVAEQGADGAAHIAKAWQARAPVTLRVNHARTTCQAVQDTLAQDGIIIQPNPRAIQALTVTDGARRLRQHALYSDGLIEFQDASSQAVIASLPRADTVLDFCAGGGGKALALAADGCRVTAHDIDLKRMADVPERARRAGVSIDVCGPDALDRQSRFDLVLCDAPCSGSGAWRRSPEGKWSLTPARLEALTRTQANVLDQAMQFVASQGYLAFVTCSVLASENETSAERFLARHPDWHITTSKKWTMDADGDGFYLAIFHKG